MIPASGAAQDGSSLLKITLLGIVFTAGYFPTRHITSSLFKRVNSTDTAQVAIATPLVEKKMQKTIYLTFDDGPNKGTQKVLDILRQEQVNATLFLVGEHVYGSRQQSSTYDSIVANRYVEVANHSYSHALHNKYGHFYKLPEFVYEDFKRCADSLQLISNIVRTPGRNIWRTTNLSVTDIASSTAAADGLKKNGFTVMGWDLEWHFTNNMRLVQSTEEMVQRVDSMFSNKKNRTEGHLVLLAHDLLYKDAKDSTSLHRFISLLKEKGEYNFATVSEYPISAQ